MVRILLLCSTLLLSACAIDTVSDRIDDIVENPELITKKRYNDLINLPAIKGNIIPIAVYKFPDLTGQRKPASNFASLSSAVTQGAEVFLIKALRCYLM